MSDNTVALIHANKELADRIMDIEARYESAVRALQDIASGPLNHQADAARTTLTQLGEPVEPQP